MSIAADTDEAVLKSFPQSFETVQSAPSATTAGIRLDLSLRVLHELTAHDSVDNTRSGSGARSE